MPTVRFASPSKRGGSGSVHQVITRRPRVNKSRRGSDLTVVSIVHYSEFAAARRNSDRISQ